MKKITINDRVIGPQSPCYFIAEISANHLRDFNRAVKLVEKAKEAGADAVKFQTYRPDTITFNSNGPAYRLPKDNPYGAENLYQLYEMAHMPWDWHRPLMEKALSLGLNFFSTPFDETAVDLLEDLNVPAYKIASFELVDIPLIKKVAKTGKPLIISTGMAAWGEIEAAVQAALSDGERELVLLKCVSAYPACPDEFFLNDIPLYGKVFNVLTGLSDHQLGDEIVLGAVALGAKVIEKHFTLKREDGGPDSVFSLEPQEFSRMVKSARILEQALKTDNKRNVKEEDKNIRFRPSIIVTQSLNRGDVITDDHVATLRPNVGLPPCELENVVGKRANKSLSEGQGLTRGDVVW